MKGRHEIDLSVPVFEDGQVERIMVYVSVRPLSKKEIEAGARSCVHVVNNTDLYLTEFTTETDYLRLKRLRGRHYAFDAIFREAAEQEDVYMTSTTELIEGVFQGRNGSVFCYGATGAGKTHTMLGTIKNPGVMVLAIKDLFAKLRQWSRNGEHVVRLSYLEVYNESVKDLLSPGRPLVLREDKQGTVAAGLTHYQAYSAEEVMEENDMILNRQGDQQSLISSLRSNQSAQPLQQAQNNTDIFRTSQTLLTNDQTMRCVEEGIRPVISSMPNQSGFLPRENGFHQFWRAGDYDVRSTQKRTITGGMDHVRVHPKFLHSNATSHKWAFGAIAELLDNAIDEIQNGATYVKADQIFNPRDYSHALLFQDDGGGMDPECIRRCMSLGYSMKNTNTTIGQYGNGFKTSTMRLGADAIVFTRSACGSSSTQSIGLLSYTFLRKTGQDDIIVPMVDFELPSDHGAPRMLVRSTEDTWTKNLATILQWSPYATETELMKQFEDIGPHGTKVVVYNLWLNDDGILELDFDTDNEDIKLRGGLKPGKSTNSHNELLQSHISYRHLYSLRAYASILYLRRLPNFQIILRGKPVEYHSIADDLKFSKVVIYKPQLGAGMKEVSVATTIGFTKEAPLINVHGFNIYHKNRLIMPFWKVWQDNSSRGRGVVGVLEANFIEPAHDKQDFEKTAVLLRLESRLKQMTLDFWRDNCDLIGYQGKNKSRREDTQSNLPSIQNPRPLASVVPGLPSAIPAVSTQKISNSQGMPPLTNPVGNVQAVTSGKELQSVGGTSNKLVNTLCDENIQLFMRCEQYRHRQLELNQMITKLESELKDGKTKFAQLASNVEAQKKQRQDMLRKVHGR